MRTSLQFVYHISYCVSNLFNTLPLTRNVNTSATIPSLYVTHCIYDIKSLIGKDVQLYVYGWYGVERHNSVMHQEYHYCLSNVLMQGNIECNATQYSKTSLKSDTFILCIERNIHNKNLMQLSIVQSDKRS